MKLNKKANIQTILATMVFIFMIIGAILFTMVSVIPDGKVGVYTLFGDINEREIQPGIHFFNPFAIIHEVDVKQKTITEQATVPAKDGLSVTVDLSVIYRIKDDQAADIRQSVSGSIENTKLIPMIRSILRDVSSTLDASEIYSPEGRSKVQTELKMRLEESIGVQLEIDNVLLREVKLPPTVTAAIERKLDQQQKAQAKEFELEAAKLDAEIEIERAKGIAESQSIIDKTLTAEYIQYRFIETLEQTTNQVIYVSTENNMPITEANRLSIRPTEVIEVDKNE